MNALATHTTTEGPIMAETQTHSPPGTILLEDIARFWTEERRKKDPLADPIKRATVLSYVKESRTGRYQTNPMPLPETSGGGYLGSSRQAPWWPASTEKALRDWFTNRPGHGHGTGGRYAGRAAKVAKPAKRRKGTGTNAKSGAKK